MFCVEENQICMNLTIVYRCLAIRQYSLGKSSFWAKCKFEQIYIHSFCVPPPIARFFLRASQSETANEIRHRETAESRISRSWRVDSSTNTSFGIFRARYKLENWIP